MTVACFMIEERNRRPNDHLDADIAERGGGPTEIGDWYRVDNDELLAEGVGGNWPMGNAPPGAMWFFDTEPNSWYRPHAGPNLFACTPNGHAWCIDARASNCGLPDDNEHYCWVRHGDPPNVTVDKDGVTCQAGAGSIQSGDYHGFLQGGVFT